MTTDVKRDPWCRHRTAFDRKKFPVCKAGVDYHQYDGPFDMMPCLGSSPQAIARCPQFSGWTAEENAARELEYQQAWARITLAIKAIREAAQGDRGCVGRTACPSCNGHLHYSIARVNGHIHARCDTPNCVSFIQ